MNTSTNVDKLQALARAECPRCHGAAPLQAAGEYKCTHCGRIYVLTDTERKRILTILTQGTEQKILEEQHQILAKLEKKISRKKQELEKLQSEAQGYRERLGDMGDTMGDKI